MSYSEMRPDGMAVFPASVASGSERLVFLRKVYSLVFSGLVVFGVAAVAPIIGIMAKIPGLEQFGRFLMTLHPMISFLVLIGSSMLLHRIERVPGLNLIALYGMAAIWGFVSVPLMAYAIMFTGGPAVVFQALGLTTLVFGGLTAYVFLSRKDFSYMGGMLMIGSFILIGGIVIALIGSFFNMPMSLLSMGLTIFSTILFMGYVLYDTSQVLHRYSTDMAVPAAMALMVDFIILFRNILYLLLSSRR